MLARVKLIILGALLVLTSCSSSKKSTKQAKADIYYQHGTNHLVTEQYTQALSMLLKSKEMGRKDAKLYNNLGLAFYFKKDLRQAKENFLRAIDVDQKHYDALSNLAALYYYEGNLRESKKYYLKVSKVLTYPHQYRTFHALSLISIKEKDRPQAIRYLNLSLKERSDYCPAHFQKGLISEENGNLQEAYKSYFEASKGTCIKEISPLLSQAKVLMRLKKFALARFKLEDILKRFTTDPRANLARSMLSSLKDKAPEVFGLPDIKTEANLEKLKRAFLAPQTPTSVSEQ